MGHRRAADRLGGGDALITVASLKKWAALEPDNWICQLEGDYCWIALSSYQRNRVYIIEGFSLPDKALIQAGVQYAIASKRWLVSIDFDHDLSDPPEWFVDIQLEPNAERSFVATSQEIATALLEAYLAALERIAIAPGGNPSLTPD